MATNKVVIGGSFNVTAHQLAEMFKQIGSGALNGFHIQWVLDHQDPFGLYNLNDRRIWTHVYRLCGVDFSPGKFNWDVNPGQWVVPVASGITPNRIVQAMRELGIQFTLSGEDLDSCLINDRQTSGRGSYLIRLKAQVESEEEFNSVSEQALRRDQVVGINLVERLLLEFAFHLFTGKHLDNSFMTLCSGSSYRLKQGHRVPVVYFENGKVRVGIVNSFESLKKVCTRRVELVSPT